MPSSRLGCPFESENPQYGKSRSIVREGLQSMLERSEEFEVVGPGQGRSGGGESGLRTVARRDRHGRYDAEEGRRGGVPGDHGVSARHTGGHADRLDGGGRRDRGGGRRSDRLPSEGVGNGPAPERGEGRGCGRDASAGRRGKAGLHQDTQQGDGGRGTGGRPDPEGEGDTCVVGCHLPRLRRQVKSSRLPSETPSTTFRRSWVLARSRRSWSGPCGTVCWMTDPTGRFPRNLAGPGARSLYQDLPAESSQ